LPQYTVRTDRPTGTQTNRWARQQVSKISRLRLIVSDAPKTGQVAPVLSGFNT